MSQNPFKEKYVLAVVAIGGLLLLMLAAIVFAPPKSDSALGKITNNSLLPHQFVGTCVNCHTINQVHPISINNTTMQHLPLRRYERILVRQGQEVMIPNNQLKLQAPQIFTGQTRLPHQYVGVCSNCHTVLDVGRTKEFMKNSMRLARTGNLIDETNARSKAARNKAEVREELRDFWGWVSLILFIIGSIYVVMRGLIRKNKNKFAKMFKINKWLIIHEWTAVFFTFAVLIHWYYSDRGNNFLHLSLFIIGWLFLAGITLRSRVIKGQAQKNLRLLHAQQFLFYLLIILLIIGHLVGAEG